MSISTDTIIMPEVIAESVVHELAYYMYVQHGETLANTDTLAVKLTDTAERLYACRPDIRKKFKRDAIWGRDWLHCFMRHWLASDMKDSRVPARFANGEELRP